jgi:hypothetical protein
MHRKVSSPFESEVEPNALKSLTYLGSRKVSLSLPYGACSICCDISLTFSRFAIGITVDVLRSL